MLLVTLLICICAWWLCRQWQLQRLTARIPTLPGWLPIIGHAHQLVGGTEWLWQFLQGIQTKATERGGIVKMWLGPSLVFVITDPKIALNTLNIFVEKIYVYNFAQSWLGKGLLTADALTWKRHRKLLNPTFNQRILDGFLEVFNELSARFVEDLEKELANAEFDIQPYLQNISLKNICQTALGLSTAETLQTCNKEYINAVYKMFKIMCIRFQNICLHPSSIYNWTKIYKEEEELVKILKKMSTNVLRTRKIEITENLDKETKKSDRSMKGFLDYLLELQSDGLLTDKEITEEVDTLIVGGTDTIARTLIFTLVLIASNPDVQDRLYKEIQQVLFDSSTNIDVKKEHLSQLVYLEAVIKEALRIYPIVPVIARNITHTYRQDDLVLPSGCGIMVLISGLHRNDYWGKDADVFKPERWLDGSLPKDPAAFASFSLGRRGCLGRVYAMMLMKTTLAHFLRHYQVSRKDTELRLKLDILLSPVTGHHISINLRQ